MVSAFLLTLCVFGFCFLISNERDVSLSHKDVRWKFECLQKVKNFLARRFNKTAPGKALLECFSEELGCRFRLSRDGSHAEARYGIYALTVDQSTVKFEIFAPSKHFPRFTLQTRKASSHDPLKATNNWLEIPLGDKLLDQQYIYASYSPRDKVLMNPFVIPHFKNFQMVDLDINSWKFMHNGDTLLLREAVALVRFFAETSPLDHALASLSDKRTTRRRYFLDQLFLHFKHDKIIRAAVRPLLQDPDLCCRIYAARILGLEGLHKLRIDLPLLAEMEPRSWVHNARELALLGIIEHGGREDIAALLELSMKELSNQVHMHLTMALRKWSFPEGANYLLELVEYEDEAVVIAATQTLLALNHSEFVTALQARARRGSPHLQQVITEEVCLFQEGLSHEKGWLSMAQTRTDGNLSIVTERRGNLSIPTPEPTKKGAPNLNLLRKRKDQNDLV